MLVLTMHKISVRSDIFLCIYCVHCHFKMYEC